MTRHKRTIEQKFKAIVAMIVAMGLVSGFTLQDGTISEAWSLPAPTPTYSHTTCSICGNNYDAWEYDAVNNEHYEKCTSCDVNNKGTGPNNHTPVYDDGAGNYYYYHDADNKDYPICRDCGYIDKSGTGVDCGNYLYAYDDAVTVTQHARTCGYCGDQVLELHHYDSPNPVAGNNHEFECKECHRKYTQACSITYSPKGDGAHHFVICGLCGRDEEVDCTIDSDGLCDVCQHEDKVAKDAAKAAVKTLYDTAKNTYNWQDSYGNAGINDPADPQAVWVTGLTHTEFSALVSLYNDMNTKYSVLDSKPAVQSKVDDYLNGLPSMYGLLDAILYRLASPLTDVPVKINVYETGTTTPIKDVAIKLTAPSATPSGYIIVKHGYTIVLDGGLTTSQTGTSAILANDTFAVSQDGPNANGYKPLETGTYNFTATNGGAPYFTVDPSNTLSWVLTASGTDKDELNIYIEPLPKVELKLVKEDGTSPLTGATVKISDGLVSPTVIEYKQTDKIVVGIPSGGKALSYKNGILTIDGTTPLTILEGTTPDGYRWGTTGPYKFTANTTTGAATITAGSGANFSETSGKLKMQYDKIPVITAKFLEKTTNTPLTGCSVKLQSTINTTQSEIFEPGDTIHVGTLASGKDISKTGTVITIKAGVNFKILSNVAPLYHKNLEDDTFEFNSNAAGAITLSGGGGTGAVTSPTTSELDFFFDKAPTIKFKTSGDGAPDKTGLTITEKFGAKRSFKVASASSPAVELADGEYSVTTTNAAKGYKGASGTFKIVGGKVSSSASDFSGACEYSADDTVAIKFTKDDKLDDIKVYVYPKKDGKDAPDTKANPIKGWTYSLQRYEGDKSDPTKDTDSDNWKTVISKVEPASGKDYAVLDAEKLSLGETYRLKMGENSYAYFELDEDGKVNPIKGHIATNDDGDEIQLWIDEDSDDVIAIHKQTSTGTELAGAKLQIYLYTAENTLAYGSSSSTTSNNTNNNNNNNSNSSNSNNSSNNNSSSSTSTRAKITPSKPTVATSDILFDWTSGDKAYTIDIDKLEKGKNYTLREVSAPSGYETPAYDFVFKYNTDGTLTVVRNYANLLSVSGNKLILKNQTPTEAAATRPKTGDHSKLALWLDICIVMLGGLYLSGYSIVEAFTEKKKVKVVAKKKANNRRRR